MSNVKKSILAASLQEITLWCESQGHQKFRGKQIHEWIWKKAQIDVAKMTNLSADLRSQLLEEFTCSPLTLVKIHDSEDGETQKFLWKLEDGAYVESVLIIAPDRKTVCVSSQVGCPARCAFCASGKKGLIRNLTSAEIVAQVLLIQGHLQTQGEVVTNVVYMGMGEPLKNYENVTASIRMMTSPDLFGMSPRRITVSTVGVIEGITRFARENLKVNLVLSLHAPNQTVRQKIIPYARQYPLDEILLSMDDFQTRTGRDVTYEYTLLEGINDEPEHAQELARLLKGKQCTVNLIPYNPIPGIRLKRPSTERIVAFRQILDSARIINTCRYTKGVDIAAACGQLALQEKDLESSQEASCSEVVSKSETAPLLRVINS